MAPALVLAPLLAAAYLAFPDMDDTYLLLLLKERGALAVAAAHRDRPLVGHLLQGLAVILKPKFWTGSLFLHALLWICLAWQTMALTRRIFPELWPLGGLAACLALSPVVVQTQSSFVTVSLIGLLSVVVAYAAFFLLWDGVRRSTTNLVLGSVLLGVDALFSEYAVAAGLSIAVLLAGASRLTDERISLRRRCLASASVLACIAAGYSVLLLLSAGARLNVDPRLPLRTPELLQRFPVALPMRLWEVVVGGYARALVLAQPDLDSKSSLLALAYGGLVATVVVASSRRAPPLGEHAKRSMGILFIALTAGLIPVTLMRHVSFTPFPSRFHLPILPIAVLLTMSLGYVVVRDRYVAVVIGLLAWLTGVTSFRYSWNTVQRLRTLRMAEVSLRDRVTSAPGLTLVALSGDEWCLSAYACTSKVTATWSAATARRIWIYPASESAEALGDRLQCRPLHQHSVRGRGYSREGAVSQILWLDVPQGTLEPYCVRPSR